jgi:hypothetical protein
MILPVLHSFIADASTIITNSVNKACGSNCGNSNLGGVFGQVANALLYLTGALSVVMLIVGGLRYVTSNGNPKNITAAKDTIVYSLIGLVVSILAFAIITYVVNIIK